MRRIMMGLALVFTVVVTGCAGTEKGGATVTPTPKTVEGLIQKIEIGEIGKDDIIGVKETPEKNETGVMEKYNAVNRRWDSETISQESLFCIDGETGVIYFVNQYNDYFIYRLSNGEATLAVSLPAKDLYMHDGKLYFMLESYSRYQWKDMADDDIYVYTPSEGTVELVYAVGTELGELPNRHMVVNENGISFNSSIEMENTVAKDGREIMVVTEKALRLSFDGKDPVSVSTNEMKSGWREYYPYLTKVDGEMWLSLFSKENTKEEIMLQRSDHMSEWCIIEDDLYLVTASAVFSKINLITMEKQEYDFSKMVKELYDARTSGQGYSGKFCLAVTEEAVFLATQTTIDNYLFRIDLNSGEQTYYKIPTTKSIKGFYTDGKNLYIATSDGMFQTVFESYGENKVRLQLKNLSL